MLKEIKNGPPHEEQVPNTRLDSQTLPGVKSGESNENLDPDEQQAWALLKKLKGDPEAAGITFDDAFRYALDGDERVDPAKALLLAKAERYLKKEVSGREKSTRTMSYLEIPGNNMKSKLCFVLGIDPNPDSMDGTTLGSETFRAKPENASFLRELAVATDVNIGEVFKKRLEAYGFRTEDFTVIGSVDNGYPRTINLLIAHHDDQKSVINRSFFLHIGR